MARMTKAQAKAFIYGVMEDAQFVTDDRLRELLEGYNHMWRTEEDEFNSEVYSTAGRLVTELLTASEKMAEIARLQDEIAEAQRAAGAALVKYVSAGADS